VLKIKIKIIIIYTFLGVKVNLDGGVTAGIEDLEASESEICLHKIYINEGIPDERGFW
jgi:hypothetical protein